MTLLHAITNSLLAVLIVVELLNVLGLYLNRRKVDESMKALREETERVAVLDAKRVAEVAVFNAQFEAQRAHLRKVQAWIELQQLKVALLASVPPERKD